MTSPAAPTRQARLALTPHTSLAGLLDGAWWPYSRDLSAELPSLVDTLEEHCGRITRLTANPASWPVVPRAVPVHGHTVHVGWFTEQDSDTMILLSSYNLHRCDLLVIPPETEPTSATRLMAAASTPGNLHTAGILMSDEDAPDRHLREARVGEDASKTEGGADVRPHFRPVVGARMIPLPRNMRR
ncbi:DUF5994 family protein [Streptomyces sp. NPDC046371]|uniref:DUF5994 family protein n=1 Tax=Streptomyces sp. NPDC046371 TaxID=3154916 RepID=UPI0033FF76FF